MTAVGGSPLPRACFPRCGRAGGHRDVGSPQGRFEPAFELMRDMRQPSTTGLSPSRLVEVKRNPTAHAEYR